MHSIRNPPKNDRRRVIIERKATGRGMNPRKSSRFQHECISDPGLLRVYTWPIVRCDMCSSGLYFKVKSWSLDYQANCGHLWQPSYTPECCFWPKWCGHLTQFFLKPSKRKCVFQCFALGEKLYLRTRLYFMLFVLFSFFCFGIHTRFYIFPSLLSPSFWRNGKICKFGWNWLSPPLWPPILALKYLQYEHLHLTLNMFFLAEFAL